MKEKENEICEQYFAEKEEQAVIDYITTNSIEEKNRIYNQILIEPFKIMSETILRRYPIYKGKYEYSEIEKNGLTHLIEHMVRYRPFIIEYKVDDKWIKMTDEYRYIYVEDADDGLKTLKSIGDFEYRLFYSRAFSYCQTILRNYYKDHGKKNYTESKTNLSFEDYVDEINDNAEYSYEMELENQHQLEKLIECVIVKINNKIDNETCMKKNEIMVGDAIVNVLQNWHVLFMEDSPEGKYNKRVTNKFAKNKILLFLKEQTGLSTKEIRIAIKPFKEIYFIEKIDYLED